MEREECMKKVSGTFKRILRDFSGAFSAAAITFVAPYLAFTGSLGQMGIQAMGELVGNVMAERLGALFGIRRIDEKDIRDMFSIVQEKEEVRRDLLKLLESLLKDVKLDDEELKPVLRGMMEIEETFPKLRKEIEEIKERLSELPELKKRIENLEERMKAIEVREIISLTWDNLIEELGVAWVRRRDPLVSSRLREKIRGIVEDVVRAYEEGRELKIAILGEAGVGKTTALYLVSRALLDRVPLHTGWPSREQGVFVIDNLPGRPELLSELRGYRGIVIATGRSEEWGGLGLAWREVLVERDDHRPVAEELLKSALKSAGVRYDEEGVGEVLRRGPLIPIHLVELAELLKAEGKDLTRETAARVPLRTYEVISEVVRNVAARDGLAVAVLYSLARTRTGWLHRNQLEGLKSKLRDLGFEGEGGYEGMLDGLGDSMGLRHEVWREILVKSWSQMGLGREPGPLLHVRSYNVERLVREACSRSLDMLEYLRGHSAAEAVMRALKNFPDLSEEAVKKILQMEGDRRALTLDVVAIVTPGSLIRGLQGDVNSIERLADELDGAPSAEAELYGHLVEHYRRLAEVDERFLPDLAMTLNNLGNALSDKGRLDEAIERYEEALKHYRRLAEVDERFLPDLAMTLNNLGNALSDKGRLDEAIERYEEALRIRRRLAEVDERFLPNLAGTLNNLGAALSRKGRLDEAIERYEEALRIRRRLAEVDERFLPNLAGTLNNLGNALSDKGRLDEAIERYEEALRIRRRLAEVDERFLPDLAMTLNNLGAALSRKGRLDEAIERYEEALKHYRRLAEVDERFLPDLAGTLNNLGNALSDKGRLDEAIERYEEARKIVEPLIEDFPWLRSELATSHIGLGMALASIGNKESAIDHLCKALDLLLSPLAPSDVRTAQLILISVEILQEMISDVPSPCREKVLAAAKRMK